MVAVAAAYYMDAYNRHWYDAPYWSPTRVDINLYKATGPETIQTVIFTDKVRRDPPSSSSGGEDNGADVGMTRPELRPFGDVVFNYAGMFFSDCG